MSDRNRNQTPLIYLLITPILFCLWSPWLDIKSTHAISNNGIAQYQTVVSSAKIEDGHLVSLVDGVYRLSDLEYDSNLHGVIDTEPSLSLGLSTLAENSYPIAQIGHIGVLVTNSNGDIKMGDLITTSKTPGVGMKANDDGYVVGQALENSEPTDNINTPQTILVSLYIHQTGTFSPSGENQSDFDRTISFLSELFRFTNPKEYDEPTLAFRYLLSAIIILVTVAFGYSNFARMANSGVQALGRNPLASRMITVGIIINVAISLAIIASGFFIAYYILTT